MNKKSRLDKTNNKSEQNTLVSPQTKQEGSAYAEGLSGQKNKASEQETKSLINLPKGGGAIQGIGEKFEANPVNGTFSMSVPIAISPGRAGFSPQLALSYNSGSGNSAFGLGWNIGIPNITRKTDKGLPRYNDSDNTLPSESDTFILSGAEDLIPLQESPRTENDYRIKRYIPRTEGLFARIEQWKNTKTGYIYWRTISKENIVSIYGQTTEATIHHPSDTNKIFTWYLQYSFDAKGNCMHYIYKKEDGANVISEPYEFNRIKSQKSFNKIYLSKVCYGNTKMCDEQGNLPNDNNWLFTLAFDYGEYPKDINYSQKLDTTKAWDLRTDPFSSYKAGFEIRTYRLCKRVLMFHKFDELGNTEKLVKATCFNYTNHTHLTLLNKVTHQSFSNGS
ncbi:MAG: hypothetical protein MI739_05175, partial [Bacteroidales bacterium]|nr:hypothetical protein [Bacteroidales bacterium]